MLVTTAAVSVAAAAAASAPSTATAALENCKRLTAGGKTWQVSATAKAGCATARNIVRQVTARKPDRVSRAQGGELDRYRAPFSGLRCFKSQKAKLGGEIQCTSEDGRQTVLAIYRG
jgi:hypothetical protein